MAEVFKEYLIKQKKSPKDMLAQTGLVIGALVLSGILFVVGGDFIGPLLIVGIIFGAGFLFNKFSREYEYILTNNELDIDVIYNRNSRKRVITFDMKKINLMASIADERYTNEINRQGMKVINASDNENKENTYAIITDTEKNGLCKILITPNNTLLEELYRQAPNKVYKINKFTKKAQ
ncbi:MAG: hypothetical protein J6F30_05935 [Cellulosilyticum sp.]|nr:hypothetical protein [Cellulosilyticum sp.]